MATLSDLRLGRKCFACKRVRIEQFLSDCPVCEEPICAMNNCSARCRCNIKSTTSTLDQPFSERLIESMCPNKDVVSWVKNERGVYTHTNPLYVERYGDALGGTDIEVYGDCPMARERIVGDQLVLTTQHLQTSIQTVPYRLLIQTLLVEKMPIYGRCVFGFALVMAMNASDIIDIASNLS